jgi:hypothetical protein
VISSLIQLKNHSISFRILLFLTSHRKVFSHNISIPIISMISTVNKCYILFSDWLSCSLLFIYLFSYLFIYLFIYLFPMILLWNNVNQKYCIAIWWVSISFFSYKNFSLLILFVIRLFLLPLRLETKKMIVKPTRKVGGRCNSYQRRVIVSKTWFH